MPELDLSDLTFDLDLTDNFIVLRRLQQVNQYGEVGEKDWTYYNVQGAVYPTGDAAITKQDAYQTQSLAITVVTKFHLRGIAQDSQQQQWLPDYVVWQGSYYEVKSTNWYNRYGGGFLEAQCIQTNLVGAPIPRIPP